ncbi:MAG: DotU family type IV/VI secretion system protein [Holosporales bacterium]|jgi:type VI secretion system protein ImpK|nr:DotU family type IV/VI secretion system protein [Holosporales bacterium]
MAQFKASNNHIVHGFQAFYYELLRQKEICLSKFFSNDPEISKTEEVTEFSPSLEIEGIIVAVQKKLIATIENVFEVISSKSRISARKLEEAKYIMAILTDEIFINMRWDGAKFWRFSLLEKQMFNSEVAGEKFFSLLDELLDDMNSANQEIAFLYLMALSLGFKGRYKDAENSNEYISWYKDKLYSMLHNKSSRLFYPGRSRLIESCYDNTITEDAKQSLPDTRFWGMVVMGVVVAYLVVSYVVWFGITDDISDILNHISDQIKRGPLV